MNVLVFVENYVSGGSDLFLKNLLKYNGLNNYTIFYNKNCPPLLYEDFKSSNNIKLVQYDFITPNDLFNKSKGSYFSIFYLLYIVLTYPIFLFSIFFFFFKQKNNKYDLYLINNGGYPGGYCSRAFNISLNIFSKGKKIYHLVHSNPDNYKPITYFFERYLIDPLVNRNTTFVAVCDFIKKSLIKKRNFKNITVIENGVRDSFKEIAKSHKNFNIIQLASINKNKNQLLSLKALDILVNKKKYLNIKINFFGEISDLLYYDRLLIFINKKKLNKHVKFHGLKKDVAPELNKSNLLLLTSFVEGFPLSILEAFSCKVPVISTNTGGVSEQIKSGENGFLLNNYEELELSNFIEKLYKDKNLCEKIGNINRLKYLEKYTLEKMNNNYKLILKL